MLCMYVARHNSQNGSWVVVACGIIQAIFAKTRKFRIVGAECQKKSKVKLPRSSLPGTCWFFSSNIFQTLTQQLQGLCTHKSSKFPSTFRISPSSPLSLFFLFLQFSSLSILPSGANRRKPLSRRGGESRRLSKRKEREKFLASVSSAPESSLSPFPLFNRMVS